MKLLILGIVILIVGLYYLIKDKALATMAYGMFGISFVIFGIHELKRPPTVKDYLRGDVEIIYKYEMKDSVLIPIDTIAKFK